MFKLCSFTFPSSSKAQANPSVRNYDSTLHFSSSDLAFVLGLSGISATSARSDQVHMHPSQISFFYQPSTRVQTFTFSHPSQLEASEYRGWGGGLTVPQVLTQAIGTLAYNIRDSTKLWPSRHLHSARTSTVHIYFFCFNNVWTWIL